VGHNVQSKAGESLTDLYDVRGGQAPIERIETNVVQGVHELGATIQSERFSQTVRKVEHLGGGQSTNFNVSIGNLPDGVWKVDSVYVTVSSDASRLTKCCAGFRSAQQRDVPLWVWDENNSRILLIESDALGNGVIVLSPDPVFSAFPQLASGLDQPASISELFLSGTLGAFGAGTEDIKAWFKISFCDVPGIVSPRGLPIPSW